MTLTTSFVEFGSELRANDPMYGDHVRFPHFHHDLAMSFLDPQVRKNSRKKFIQTLTRYISFVDPTAIKVLSFFSHNLFPIMNAKKFMKPFHNGFIDRSKLKYGSVNERVSSCFRFDCIDVKTSVSVNITCKISKIKFCHENSFATIYAIVEYKSTVNDLASGIRKDMRKSELIGDYERKLRRGIPARKGHKSNRMPVLNSAAARLGQALRETQDALVRDQLESTASVINCVNGQNGDLPTEMSIEDIDDVVTVLQNNSGEYITSIVEADLKFGTAPIGDSYGCMLTTRMIPVLNGIKGFTRKFQYPNISQTLATEWGGVDNVRFFISEQGSVTPNASLLGNDIANCFVSAKEAYKVVWQAGGKSRFIYLPPGLMMAQAKSSLIDLELLAA